MRPYALTLACLLLTAACDSPPTVDAGPRVDAGPIEEDAGPLPEDAGPVDAGEVGPPHCLGADPIIEAIDIGTSITIFNPTSEALVMDDLNYFLCERPTYPELNVLEAGVTIEAGGRHVYAWPAGFTASAAAGELALYRFPSFENTSAIADYFCWGTGIDPSRKTVAEGADLWSGDCAPALSGTTFARVPDSDGASSASYDDSGSAAPLSCP